MRVLIFCLFWCFRLGLFCVCDLGGWGGWVVVCWLVVVFVYFGCSLFVLFSFLPVVAVDVVAFKPCIMSLFFLDQSTDSWP